MYMPPHFAINQPEVLHRIIREHPLGALVTQRPDGLDADHIPFEFDPGAGAQGTLLAHVLGLARSTLYRKFAELNINQSEFIGSTTDVDAD